VLLLSITGCDGCGPRKSRVPPLASSASTEASSRSPAPESGTDTAAVAAAPKVGSATVNGTSADPVEVPTGYRRVAAFTVTLELAHPGQHVLFELVDRVAPGADADDAHRILTLDALVGKEKSEGVLSFFDAEGGEPQKTPARKVRLVFGREKAEVDVSSAHLPSRRGRASVTSLKNPVLHPNAWAPLLFYAQSKDDRGLEVTPIEPPKLVLEGKAYDYPAWPEPGLVWRVRVGAL
jgi:hypothetical protein